MTRNLKLFVLGVCAALALSAVVASLASGGEENPIQRPYWFKSDGFSTGTTTLTGVQGKGADEIETETLTVSCPSVTYKGSLKGETATTITLTPTFQNCTAGADTATVDVNGCSYTLHTDEQTGNVTSPVVIDWFNAFDTTTTIECPTTTIDGKKVTDEIQITVTSGATLKCTIDIPEQNLGTGITLEEKFTGTKDIPGLINFSKVTYTQTAGMGAGACTEFKDKATGKYRGAVTISGDNPLGEPTSVWVDSLS